MQTVIRAVFGDDVTYSKSSAMTLRAQFRSILNITERQQTRTVVEFDGYERSGCVELYEEDIYGPQIAPP